MRFALIGAAGYIAPRHMKAIKDVGGELVAALDPHDSVGILDSYFPESSFFTEFERFDRHINKLSRQGLSIDYVSICSPSYLHDAHCRWALRSGINAICEKPLVLSERNLDGLSQLERETGKRIWTILQLRLHAALKAFHPDRQVHDVVVDYRTPRGRWYSFSWKNDVHKSGGLSTNIGIHLFDLGAHLFGRARNIRMKDINPRYELGIIQYERARMDWLVSINPGQTKRVFIVDNQELDFSTGFDVLHTEVYKAILNGKGFGIEDARESIRICETIRLWGPNETRT